jgi:hypothetical protein
MEGKEEIASEFGRNKLDQGIRGSHVLEELVDLLGVDGLNQILYALHWIRWGGFPISGCAFFVWKLLF